MLHISEKFLNQTKNTAYSNDVTFLSKIVHKKFENSLHSICQHLMFKSFHWSYYCLETKYWEQNALKSCYKKEKNNNQYTKEKKQKKWRNNENGIEEECTCTRKNCWSITLIWLLYRLWIFSYLLKNWRSCGYFELYLTIWYDWIPMGRWIKRESK